MKGIIFSEPMFHATIEGRKTQTRRIIKPQPISMPISCDYAPISTHPSCDILMGSFHYPGEDGYEFIRPRYKSGEKLYLKEPYCNEVPGYFGVAYKYYPSNVNRLPEEDTGFTVPWKNKLFMPAKYARYFIEITAVKCDRVQNISNDDCCFESIYFLFSDGKKSSQQNGFVNGLDGVFYGTSKQAYAALFDSINGKGAWESNPYVWIYDYILAN